MRPRHRREVDWFAICGGLGCAAAVVAEAVLDADDDPNDVNKSNYTTPASAYHRLVKTTPKPRATKKSSGELVGPLLAFVPDCRSCVGAGALLAVGEAMVMLCSSTLPYVE
jgi:hypothetical protein